MKAMRDRQTRWRICHFSRADWSYQFGNQRLLATDT